MAKTQSRSSAPATLTRSEDTATSFPGLDAVAERGCNALREMLHRFGARSAVVVRGEAEIVSASAWQTKSKMMAQCGFDAQPLKGGFSLAIDADLIMRLVDVFYGGQGNADPFSGAFCAADERMIARIGAHWVEVLPSLWRGIAPLTPELLPAESAQLHIPRGRGKKLLVQPFSVTGFGATSLTIAWGYPLDFLRQMPALSHDEQPEAAPPPDPKWHRQMRLAVNEVSLPIRTIFARPEVPLSRLLVLKPGDIIPVCLPSTVPVTVAGRVFAEATVGEAGGRTAIKIERIVEGTTFHD